LAGSAAAQQGDRPVRIVVPFAAGSAPDIASYASAGVGTSSHRAGEFLAKMTGIEMVHVPSNQSPLPDVVAGRVDLVFANIAMARWQRAARGALATMAVKARLQSLGIEPLGDSPDELRMTIERESRKWAGLIR